MNKHAAVTLVLDRQQQKPKHNTGWTRRAEYIECQTWGNGNTGKHAKPFGKHHPATPVVYNQAGTVAPLFPTTHALDMAA